MRGLAMIKFLAVLMFLFSSNANAACTPVPDCVSIGYTETSCEGGSLKCPFDTSKLKCIPCDSSFRYDCRGDNISGGIGATCSGKYVTCECSPGAIFNNGECICDNSCKKETINKENPFSKNRAGVYFFYISNYLPMFSSCPDWLAEKLTYCQPFADLANSVCISISFRRII